MGGLLYIILLACVCVFFTFGAKAFCDFMVWLTIKGFMSSIKRVVVSFYYDFLILLVR